MKEFLDKIKKYWITVWLMVAALSFFAIPTYAIYTRVTIAKRVVSTQAGIGSLFSSDHMSVSGTRTIEPFIDNSSDATVLVHVFNYVYPKEAVFRTDVTEYDLKATIGTFENDTFQALTNADVEALSGLNYSITYNKTNSIYNFEDGATHTFRECSIAGGGANSNLFTVVFDKNELGNTPNGYCIEIEATPADSDLPKLKGYIFVRFSKQAASGWRGELEDLDESNDYDGFNYYLEGNGKGYLTFRWDPTKLTINKQFLTNTENEFYTKSGSTYTKITSPTEATLPKEDGMASITIKVDSEDSEDSVGRNRYEVQFYKIDSNNPNLSYAKADVATYLPNTEPEDWEAITEQSGN